MSKRLKIDELKKLITEVRYNSVDYLYGPDVIDIKKEDGKYTVAVTSMQRYIEEKHTITQDKWDALIDGLYDDLHVNKWDHTYMPSEWVISDGQDWELQISVEGGRRRIYRGSNVYPDNWDSFESLIESFAQKQEKCEKQDSGPHK